MSEFGLELPPTTKLGADNKGEKAFIIGQSKVGIVLGVVAVLALVSSGLYYANITGAATFEADLKVETEMGESQKLSKLTAETHLQQAAAAFSEQMGKQQEEESDLTIMTQHISQVQQQVRSSIFTSIDDEKLTVADIKKVVDSEFEQMEKKIENILHEHLLTVKDSNQKSRSAMKVLHTELAQDMAQDIDSEKRYNEAKLNPKKQTKKTEVTKKANHSEKSINQIFDHVYTIAHKMEDHNIESLISTGVVAEWERDWGKILHDTESGKLDYDTAVKLIEEVITKDPAALKLAEVTNAFELIHEDGGRKGATELSNFRSLLKHVQWLPQYSSVLHELALWKNGKATTQQVLVWLQEQVHTGKLDDRWMAQATNASIATSE